MNHEFNTRYSQRGVVLFIALIALLVMSLAAAALIRSVDTNTMIAGNLSFKQSALVSSDRGAATAINWLDTTWKAAPTSLDTDSAANGYYATYLTLNLDDSAVLKADATWSNATSQAATGSDIVGGVEDGGKGNNIRYIVQRMCREAISPTDEKCLYGTTSTGGQSLKAKNSTEAGAIVGTINTANSSGSATAASVSPMYRVTVRVTGPNNTTSYAQTFVY